MKQSTFLVLALTFAATQFSFGEDQPKKQQKVKRNAQQQAAVNRWVAQNSHVKRPQPNNAQLRTGNNAAARNFSNANAPQARQFRPQTPNANITVPAQPRVYTPRTAVTGDINQGARHWRDGQGNGDGNWNGDRNGNGSVNGKWTAHGSGNWTGHPGNRSANWDQAKWRERHRNWDRSHRNRSWWTSHYNRFALFGGGYYYWDNNYWYPAYGYDPYFQTYAYDAPIYAYDDQDPGQVIANVQSSLRQQGYYRGPVDGTYGPITRQALLNFQRDNGLPESGQIDEETLGALGLQ